MGEKQWKKNSEKILSMIHDERRWHTCSQFITDLFQCVSHTARFEEYAA